MQNKTAEEILNNMQDEMPYHLPIKIRPYIIEAIKAHADQEVSKAIDKALEVCANLSQEMIYDRDKLTNEQSKEIVLRNFQVCYATSKQSILTLKPEILKELNNG